MSDSRKVPEDHSSSDEESKTKKTLNTADNADEDLAASEAEVSEFINANPILYSLLISSLSFLNPILVRFLNRRLLTFMEDYATLLRDFQRIYSSLQMDDMKRSLEKKETGDTSDSSQSDEYDPPAKKPLMDTSVENSSSPVESLTETSEPRRTIENVSSITTQNVGSSKVQAGNEVTRCVSDCSSSACGTETHTLNQHIISTPNADPLLLGKSGSENLDSDLSVPSGSKDSTQQDSKKNKELNGDQDSNSFIVKQVSNVLSIFEYLFLEFSELESFLDSRPQILPVQAPAEAAVAGPSSDCTASGGKPATASGGQLVTASGGQQATASDQLGSTASGGCDKMEVQESEVEDSRKGNSPADEAKCDSTSIQEHSIETSLGETDDLRDFSEILYRLPSFLSDAQTILVQCIDIAERVLCIRPRRRRASRQVRQEQTAELERYIATILETLNRLVAIRKECSELLKKCRNRNEVAGVTFILELNTRIAQAFNRLLKEILTFNDFIRENVLSSPQPDPET